MSLEDTLRQIVREEMQTAIAEVVSKVVALPPPAPKSADEYLSPEQVAKLVTVDVKTVRRWIGARQLRSCTAGRKLRVRRSDLDAFMVKQTRPEREASADELAMKLIGRGR